MSFMPRPVADMSTVLAGLLTSPLCMSECFWAFILSPPLRSSAELTICPHSGRGRLESLAAVKSELSQLGHISLCMRLLPGRLSLCDLLCHNHSNNENKVNFFLLFTFSFNLPLSLFLIFRFIFSASPLSGGFPWALTKQQTLTFVDYSDNPLHLQTYFYAPLSGVSRILKKSRLSSQG